MRWDLTNIYSSFDSEEFLSDLKNLESDLKEFTLWCNETLQVNQNKHQVEDKLEYVVNRFNDLSLKA
ncbi:MAG: peptidase M3, partial [Fervidobacterium sp.]